MLSEAESKTFVKIKVNQFKPSLFSKMVKSGQKW
jgi:hypothetical protein